MANLLRPYRTSASSFIVLQHVSLVLRFGGGMRVFRGIRVLICSWISLHIAEMLRISDEFHVHRYAVFFAEISTFMLSFVMTF